MSRNRYDQGFGVRPIRWRREELPTSGRPVLVEVWEPEIDAEYFIEDAKPRVRVTASVEVRVYANGEWKRVGYGGALIQPANGVVRRWAYLPSLRQWSATVTLDGWAPEDAP